MPCATIHMLTAGRVMAEWRRSPSLAPFDSTDPELLEHFLHGAMGPDMGFVPGVDRFVSELSHYIRTGDLARTLVEAADTEQETAYAWGWVTHVLTDVKVHPLVGHAVGEHLRGDRSLRLDAAENEEAHTAMEVGLDLVFLSGEENLPSPPRRSAFGEGSIGFLARALGRTYGLEWDPRWLAGAHGRAVMATALWPATLRLVSAGRRFDRSPAEVAGSDAGEGGPRGPAPGRLQRLLGRAALLAAAPFSRPDTSLAGLLRPLRPPAWIVDEVRSFADGFAERFHLHVHTGLEELENRNLETGAPEGSVTGHANTERTVERLARIREGASWAGLVKQRLYAPAGSGILR